MENENEVMNVIEDTAMNDVETESFDKKKIVKKSVIAVGIAAAITGATVLARKYKSKIEKMRIDKAVKKLEKEGYTVVAPLSVFDEEDDVEVNP